MHVMIVDDTQLVRTIIKRTIEQMGMHVCAEAGNGQAAVEAYKEKLPDLVIMDILMPHMNGLQALREIMKLDPSTKVIICSSVGEEDTIRKAIESGAVDFITKPFTATDIALAVERSFARRRRSIG